MKKKKILFMLTSMNIGGVEKSLLSLLSVMQKERYDITLLLLERKGGFLNHIPNWIKVEEVSWYKEIKPVIMEAPQQTLRSFVKNKEYFKIPLFISIYLLSKKLNNRYLYYHYVLNNIDKHHETYDIAVAYQGPTDIIDFYIANKVNATKKVSWVHFDINKHFINQKLYQKLYQKYNKIFVVSEGAKKCLSEKIPSIDEKIEVFYNIISSALIKQMSTESVEFDPTYKGIKLVTVGRLAQQKGQDLAIKVLAKLRDDGVDIKWYCIGDGNARSEYEKLIIKYGLENHFILLGAKQNPYPYIKNADIYVQPSRYEGYCLTLAEARCLHKPIVTTNFVGAQEQLVDGFNGFIVTTDVNEMYKKLKILINHPEQREFFANNLRNENVNTINEINKLYSYVG